MPVFEKCASHSGWERQPSAARPPVGLDQIRGPGFVAVFPRTVVGVVEGHGGRDRQGGALRAAPPRAPHDGCPSFCLNPNHSRGDPSGISLHHRTGWSR
jgi:hypothetical protein